MEPNLNDNCALNSDGTLKEPHQISWVNSPSDENSHNFEARPPEPESPSPTPVNKRPKRNVNQDKYHDAIESIKKPLTPWRHWNNASEDADASAIPAKAKSRTTAQKPRGQGKPNPKAANENVSKIRVSNGVKNSRRGGSNGSNSWTNSLSNASHIGQSEVAVHPALPSDARPEHNEGTTAQEDVSTKGLTRPVRILQDPIDKQARDDEQVENTEVDNNYSDKSEDEGKEKRDVAVEDGEQIEDVDEGGGGKDVLTFLRKLENGKYECLICA